MKAWFSFGTTVAGYSVPVLNEREARAAAGILFVLGLLSFLYAYNTMDFRYTQIFVTFFMLDFLLRVVVNPSFAPSLIVGRWLVSQQTPEYVGAAQKRFAWSIGLTLSVIMFVLIVVLQIMTPIKIAICLLCLLLLFSETALGICLGCVLYNRLWPKRAQYCPGDYCVAKEKQAIQKLHLGQIILATAAFGIAGALAYNVGQNAHSASLAHQHPTLCVNMDVEKSITSHQHHEMPSANVNNHQADHLEITPIAPESPLHDHHHHAHH
jgi:hypothetical protein